MAQQWAGKTFGNGWMHRHLIRVLRFIPTVPVYFFAYVFIVPVCLVFCRSRRTSHSFYRDIMGYSPVKACRYVYRNHCVFAETVIDKFAMYAGRRFNVTAEGMENFDRLASSQDGFVMMSSHIGNYEIAGYSLVSDKKTISAVMFADEKQSVMDNRYNMFSKTNTLMITIKPDMSHLFEINAALSEGNIVSFPTDRHIGDGKCVRCNFLGREADFPLGPFSAAVMRSLDVLAVNVMKTGWNGYRIFVTPLEYDRTASRKEQILQLSRAYVTELESKVRRYPSQWFNFFDFWV